MILCNILNSKLIVFELCFYLCGVGWGGGGVSDLSYFVYLSIHTCVVSVEIFYLIY